MTTLRESYLRTVFRSMPQRRRQLHLPAARYALPSASRRVRSKPLAARPAPGRHAAQEAELRDSMDGELRDGQPVNLGKPGDR
jgi:hypothetical protein